MTTGLESRLRGTLAGLLSDAEARFCAAARKGAGEVLDSRLHFGRFVSALKQDLDTLAMDGTGAAPAPAEWVMALDGLSSNGPAPAPSAAEAVFLKDLDGLISYVSRNGLDFDVILRALAHDVGEIIMHGWSLEQALADRRHPKVSGWAERNAALIGDPDE